MRILLAEDELDMNRIIARQLAWEGYTVDACFDGQEALDYFESTDYDAAVLDVMMPKLDGFQVVERLRAAGNHTPVLFLTARDSLADKVEGLDIGGDDYLVKPFEFEELAARLRVLLRRKLGEQATVFTCGDLTLDVTRHIVTRGGKEIRLAAKEYALLEYMIRHKGVVLSREQIESNLWNYDEMIGSNVVDVYIRMLRKKIDEGYDVKLIQTIRGYGYALKETKT